jgi:ATP-dependent DNA ligase
MKQPKLNGSNCMIYTDGIQVIVMNRHGERMSRFEIDTKEILDLHIGVKGKWLVLNGEYMNKNKSDENGKWNHKLVLFDILVFNSKHLVGHTFKQRYDLLSELYGNVEYSDYLYNISDNVYLVKTFETCDVFKELIKIDMYEGLVIKRASSKLELGISRDNNSKSQVKVRKPTKNYNF